MIICHKTEKSQRALPVHFSHAVHCGHWYTWSQKEVSQLNQITYISVSWKTECFWCMCNFNLKEWVTIWNILLSPFNTPI